MPRSILVAVAVALALAGCHKGDDGPSCGAVTDRMLALLGHQMADHEGLRGPKRGVMIDQCMKQELPASVRRCIVAAKTLADVAVCRRGIELTDEELAARNQAGSAKQVIKPSAGSAAGAGSAGSGSANSMVPTSP